MGKFQVMSDLHMEMRDAVFDFPQKAPYLILAGDIGNPSEETYQVFLHEQADRFDKVFLAAGNHDRFSRSIADADKLIQEICDERENLIYLNQTSYDIDDDHVILGTTLWSEMAEHERPDLGCFMADMRHIKGWSFDENNKQHAKEKAWLQAAIRDVEKTREISNRRDSSQP